MLTSQQGDTPLLHCRKESAVLWQRSQETVFDLIGGKLDAVSLQNVVHLNAGSIKTVRQCT